MVPSSLLMWLLHLDNLAKPGGGGGGLLPPPPKPLELPRVTPSEIWKLSISQRINIISMTHWT